MSPKVELAKYDRMLLNKIRGYRRIKLDPNDGTFYSILYGNKKCGVIGFVSRKPQLYFLKAGIIEDFRGRGILGQALKLLVKKHGIRKMYATISESNIASIKASRKLGFRRIPIRLEKKLKNEGWLPKDSIRVVRSFKA